MNITEILVIRAMTREITPELMGDLVAIDTGVKVLINCPSCGKVMDTLESVLLKHTGTGMVICGECLDAGEWIKVHLLQPDEFVDFRDYHPDGTKKGE
jgi:transcription elongation factor Elf1